MELKQKHLYSDLSLVGLHDSNEINDEFKHLSGAQNSDHDEDIDLIAILSQN